MVEGTVILNQREAQTMTDGARFQMVQIIEMLSEEGEHSPGRKPWKLIIVAILESSMSFIGVAWHLIAATSKQRIRIKIVLGARSMASKTMEVIVGIVAGLTVTAARAVKEAKMTATRL